MHFAAERAQRAQIEAGQRWLVGHALITNCNNNAVMFQNEADQRFKWVFTIILPHVGHPPKTVNLFFRERNRRITKRITQRPL